MEYYAASTKIWTGFFNVFNSEEEIYLWIVPKWKWKFRRGRKLLIYFVYLVPYVYLLNNSFVFCFLLIFPSNLLLGTFFIDFFLHFTEIEYEIDISIKIVIFLLIFFDYWNRSINFFHKLWLKAGIFITFFCIISKFRKIAVAHFYVKAFNCY